MFSFRCKVLSFKKYSIFVIPFLATGCIHDNISDDGVVVSDNVAVITTIQADRSGGAHALITVDEERTVTTEILPTNGSDLAMSASGNSFFRIDRTTASIQKFNADRPGTLVSEFSVAGNEEANPQDILLLNESKAYVFRRESNLVWIVNPSATVEEDYKIGEIDFSAYADPDGNSEPVSGLLVGDKLYVVLQNMEDQGSFVFVPHIAYVAVIDTTTDQQIDIDTLTDGIQAITLPIKNPYYIVYQESLGKIFVQAGGDTWPALDYTGGIAVIDVNDYSVDTLIDDNETTNSISNIAIISDTQAYFISYKNYQDNYLFEFNPSNGDYFAVSLPELDGKDLADIEVDIDGKLWIASFVEKGIYILDPAENEIEGSLIPTVFGPTDIEFVELPQTQE